VSLTLEQIPDHGGAPAGAARTAACRALVPTGRRRTVLRAMLLGALTLGATALDWAGTFGTRKASAETGPYALEGWDRNDCRDAYPNGYAELTDTSGDYVGRYGACFGGSWRGSDFCDAGWHKYGTWYTGDVEADHVPVSIACGATSTRNAWRWTTPDGLVYRCSDGFTTYWGGGYSGQTYLTICRSAV
jgi:hypothetical protein